MPWMVNAEDKESRLASLIKTNKKNQFFHKYEMNMSFVPTTRESNGQIFEGRLNSPPVHIRHV